MDRIKVDVPGFVGEYEWSWDDQPLTGRELHWIKKISGARLMEITEALNVGDYDVVVAMTVCAMVRAGKINKSQALQAADMLLDADVGKIDYEAGPDENEEVEVGPPDGETPASVDDDTSSRTSVSDSTPPTDEIQETSQPTTGPLRSVTGTV